MNFEAFLYYQEKHRQFLEEEEEQKSIHFQFAEISNLQGIMDLLCQLWPESAPLTNKQEKQVAENLNDGSSKRWIVALHMQRVVGCISISVHNPLWSKSPILHIDELVVHSEYRRMKLGTQLIHQAEMYAQKNECHSIELDCGVQRVNEFQFYSAMGFQDISRVFSKPIS